MNGVHFSSFKKQDQKETSVFDQLLELLSELLMHTSGDLTEALDWLRELDDEYQITTQDYTFEDFLEELKERSFLQQTGKDWEPSPRLEKFIRKRALESVFGKNLKKGKGNHKSPDSAMGTDQHPEIRPLMPGEDFNRIDYTESVKSAFLRSGGGDLAYEDLKTHHQKASAGMATVLMIDISHSMILYGEDRITPAKKVALALAEMIRIRYPKDSLECVVFGNDAWQVPLKDLPYLQVGPYHTNTVAGLELAMDLLRKKRGYNKQIIMITDGKPTCIKENGEYYKNSWGQDPKILGKTLNLARECKKRSIALTTFMIAQDPYLQKFVEDFSKEGKGKAFYSSTEGLGHFVLDDYEKNRKRYF